MDTQRKSKIKFKPKLLKAKNRFFFIVGDVLVGYAFSFLPSREVGRESYSDFLFYFITGPSTISCCQKKVKLRFQNG